MDKDFKNMTLDELKVEREHWDKMIREATSWGAALTAASEFRDECDKQINWINREKEFLFRTITNGAVA